MNRHLRRVFVIYAIALLLVMIYVPWYGESSSGNEDLAWLDYRFIWNPPQIAGYRVCIDFGRMFLEVASLSVVMLLGIVWLWGED